MINSGFFLLNALTLVSALLFGGGTRQGLASDVVPQLLSLPLLAVALPRAWPRLKTAPLARAILVLIVGLPLLQLVPMPPFVWEALPGRRDIVETLAAAGVDPGWRPLSLIPEETFRAFLALLPPVAIFLGALDLDRDARKLLLIMAAAIGVLSAPLAMLQVLGGQDSGPYLYEITNVGRGVGFFANANHFGALSYCLIPLSIAGLADVRFKSWTLAIIILGVVFPALLFGLSLTGARSAFILGSGSVLASVILLLPSDLARLGRRRTVAIAAGVAALLFPLMLGLGLLGIFQRLSEQNVVDDSRWIFAAVTLRGIRDYFPFGSGVGTFPKVYPLHESVVDLIPQLVNRAHDDFLEAFLESGILAMVTVAVFFFWLLLATRASLASAFGVEQRQARAGIIVLWLLLFHSFVDYPLRTISLASIFALCAALQIAPPSPISTPRRAWWSRLKKPRKKRRRRRSSRAKTRSVEV